MNLDSLFKNNTYITIPQSFDIMYNLQLEFQYIFSIIHIEIKFNNLELGSI